MASCNPINQWIDLRENLQETIEFPIKYGVFLNFPLNQSIESSFVAPCSSRFPHPTLAHRCHGQNMSKPWGWSEKTLGAKISSRLGVTVKKIHLYPNLQSHLLE
jgi:hypothetical protein